MNTDVEERIQIWRLNRWSDELGQEECEERKRILGSNVKRREEKSSAEIGKE